MKIKQDIIKEVEISEYYKPFLQKNINDTHKIELALERAWKNRDFEIDKYWARATYFWAFIAATLAGYILIGNSKSAGTEHFQELQFAIASLGIIFSFAWCLVNKGSKKWQENWEKHIDMLEDAVNGPIYKTVLNEVGYSVSKINLLVSNFVFVIWSVLWFKTLFPNQEENTHLVFSPWKLIISAFTVCFLFAMRTKNDKALKKPSFSFRRRINKHLWNIERP